MEARRLDDALDGLVADGVLSAGQADAVRAAVAGQDPAPAPEAEAARGIHPAAEAAAWVGAVLAVVAGLTAAAGFWAELTRWAQAGLLLLACAALLAAGMAVTGDARPAARRILSVTWFLAVAALGAAAVVALSPELFEPRAVPWLGGGLVSLLLAVPLWRRHTATLQLLAVAAAALSALLAALGLFERPPTELYGLLVWALGGALVLLAWAGLARPVSAGLFAGAALTLAGAQALVLSYSEFPVVPALLTVVLLFALGGAWDHVPLTGLAAAGLAVFVPQALEAFFPESLNASAVVFLTGVALLAGALATIRRAQNRQQAPSQTQETP